MQHYTKRVFDGQPDFRYAGEELSTTSRVQVRRRLLAFQTPQRNNPAMIIGDRLREMREQKKLSQGDFQYPAPTTSMCPLM